MIRELSYCHEKMHICSTINPFTKIRSVCRPERLSDSVFLKTEEKNLEKRTTSLEQRDEVTDGLYARLRSTGCQPARL